MKTIKQLLSTLVFISTLSLLASCGGDGIGGTGIQPGNTPVAGEGNDSLAPSTSIQRVNIPFREHGYSNFETVVFHSQTQLDDFISDVNAQSAWNNKADFLQQIQAQAIDFTKESLLLYRITEPSGSNSLTPKAPTLENDKIKIVIDRNIPEVGTADVAYYALAYKVDKSITEVTIEIGTSIVPVDLTEAPIVIAPQGRLVRGNQASLLAYFQGSIKRSNFSNPVGSVEAQDQFSVAAPAAEAGVSGNSGVSSTNIQETGVDEADLIKTDGRYIYSVKEPRFHFTNGPNTSISLPEDQPSNDFAPEPQQEASDIIRIMDTQASGGIAEIRSLRDSEKPWNIAGLYLHEDQKRLVALSSLKQNYYTNWFNSGYFVNQNTDVLFINTDDPNNANVTKKISFDGTLIDSRRNGDTLYLVLRHFPNYQYTDDQRLATTTNSDFLPKYRIDNAQSQLITPPENCYFEAGQERYADVITLVALDLTSSNPQINSHCYVGTAEAIYASQNALYLATTRWNYEVFGDRAEYNNQVTTDIHKFSYQGLNFDYRGSGEVDGHLGFRQDSKSFRFSEHEDLLRVVTFDEDQWGVISVGLPVDAPATTSPSTGTATSQPAPAQETIDKSPVLVSILKEDPSTRSLQLVSKLPNANRPEPIGLPREQLYASRFIGNRAYIVTFRITDPLYVLDLSDPADPKIAGELKIDGYSEYLHPINENLLLGVGKDAIPAGPEGFGGDRGAWYQGVKLSLIDVTDPANPREADKVILGKRGTESTALYTHHGLTGLKVGDKYRVAIPVELHAGTPQSGEATPSSYYNYSNTGLYRFEINPSTQKIDQVPALIINNTPLISSDTGIYNDRSVFINDDVFYMHNGNFWKQDWQASSPVIGPK